MACTFNFPREFSLAACAVASLTPGLDLAGFADVVAECVDVFIVEAFSIRAIIVALATPAALHPTPGPITGAASFLELILISAAKAASTSFGIVCHDNFSNTSNVYRILKQHLDDAGKR